MSRFTALVFTVGVVAGCAEPKPFMLYGDANGAEIGYASDPAATLPVAKLHCAQYERVPRLLQTQDNFAYYQCIRP